MAFDADSAPTCARLGDVTGALLLGGASKRMGHDKAHLPRAGSVWSTRAAQLLDRLFTQVLLVGGEPEPEAPGTRVADGTGPPCALRGMVAALEAAASERVVILATDLPLLEPDLLLALTAWPAADAVVPVDARGDQPLCAIYRRDVCLDVARERLRSEQLSLGSFLDAVDARRVPVADLGLGEESTTWLTNVNTPEELARLEAR